jgi:hypothetical protein
MLAMFPQIVVVFVLNALTRVLRCVPWTRFPSDLREQLEYYFSDANYAKDANLRAIASANNGGSLCTGGKLAVKALTHCIWKVCPLKFCLRFPKFRASECPRCAK